MDACFTSTEPPLRYFDIAYRRVRLQYIISPMRGERQSREASQSPPLPAPLLRRHRDLLFKVRAESRVNKHHASKRSFQLQSTSSNSFRVKRSITDKNAETMLFNSDNSCSTLFATSEGYLAIRAIKSGCKRRQFPQPRYTYTNPMTTLCKI